MKGIAAQVAGSLLILVFLGGYAMLSAFGYEMGTGRSASLAPRLSFSALTWLAVPVGLGVWLILRGRRV